MPDTIPAVGAEVKPPNVLGQFSNVLGLKQQMQGLQLQQQQIGIAKAEQQQQQQTATQRTAQANFWSNFDPSKYTGADGTIDLNKVVTDPSFRIAAGDQFPTIMQSMANIKGRQLQNAQTLVNLDQSTREQFQQQIGGLRTDPDVIADNAAGRQKVKAFIDKFASLSPEAAKVSKAYAPMVENPPPGKLVNAISIAQQQAMSASAQAAAQAPHYMQTGALAVNINPQAPGGNLTGAPAYRTSIAPGTSTFIDQYGNEWAYNQADPGHAILIGHGGSIGGQPGTVPGNQPPPQSPGQPPNGAPGNAIQQNPNAQQSTGTPNNSGGPPVLGPGGRANITAQGTADQNAYSQVISAGNESPMTKNILSHIQTLAGESITGPGSKYVADAETVLGQYVPGLQGAQDEATKRQLLGKYVEQLAMRVTQANGYATDQARSLVGHAIPDPENMTPQAIKAASKFIMAQTEIAQARSSFARNYYAEHGQSSSGFQQADSAFMSAIDPRMFDLVGVSKAQGMQMLHKWFGNNQAQINDFLARAAYINKLGGFDYAERQKNGG